MTGRSMFLCVTLAVATLACKKSDGTDVSRYPGTEEGARQLLTAIRASSDAREMTLALKPSRADCQAVFIDGVAARAEAGFDQQLSDPRTVIGAAPASTALVLSKATTEDLLHWTSGVQADFPGGYKRVADKFKPGLTVYRWKYVKPGEQLGMAFDGLVYVNHHWAWFPRPWRVLGGAED